MEIVQNEVDINELYRFAKTLIKRKNILYDEELIQELVTHAAKKISTFNPDKAKKSTFFIMIMWQRFLMLERRNQTRQGKFDKSLISLNQKCVVDNGGEEIELADIVACDNKRNSQWTKKIFSIIEPMLSEELKLQLQGYTQNQIANAKKISQAQVCRNIQNNIEKIRAKLSKGDMLNYYKSRFMKSYYD